MTDFDRFKSEYKEYVERIEEEAYQRFEKNAIELLARFVMNQDYYLKRNEIYRYTKDAKK